MYNFRYKQSDKRIGLLKNAFDARQFFLYFGTEKLLFL